MQQTSSTKGPLFIEIKGFILKAEELTEKLKDGEVGLSSFQRDGIGLSKLDEFDVNPAKPKDLNPINELDLLIELVYRDDSVPVDNNGAL